MPKMTVRGVSVEIDEPYNEGHVCTNGEADALNQTRKENVRNNVVSSADRIEEKESRKLSEAEIQKMVTDYAADYQFGVRQSVTRDPVEAEAMDAARGIVRDAIRKKGLSLKEFPSSKITELASNYLAGPAGVTLRERAKAVVEARAKVAGELNLDEVKIAA